VKGRNLRKIISTGCVVIAGLLGSPTHTLQQHSQATIDQRPNRLQQFLAAMGSPVSHLAPDFVAAADRNTLDWRLLPSIAVVESGAGKEFTNNNIFGWDSGKTKFPSIRAGIHTVAARLSNSRLYKHKPVNALLATYNPRADYAARVMHVMRSIGPAEYPR
jgi:hypothetical protein